MASKMNSCLEDPDLRKWFGTSIYKPWKVRPFGRGPVQVCSTTTFRPVALRSPRCQGPYLPRKKWKKTQLMLWELWFHNGWGRIWFDNSIPNNGWGRIWFCKAIPNKRLTLLLRPTEYVSKLLKTRIGLKGLYWTPLLITSLRKGCLISIILVAHKSEWPGMMFHLQKTPCML